MKAPFLVKPWLSSPEHRNPAVVFGLAASALVRLLLAVVNGKIYVMVGGQRSGTIFSTIMKYDPATDSARFYRQTGKGWEWYELAPMPFKVIYDGR